MIINNKKILHIVLNHQQKISVSNKYSVWKKSNPASIKERRKDKIIVVYYKLACNGAKEVIIWVRLVTMAMLWVTATSAIILMIDVKQIYEPNSLFEYWQEKGVTTLRGSVTGTPQPHYFYAVLLIPYLLKRNCLLA